MDSEKWRVSASQVGTKFHVEPERGLLSYGDWAGNPYGRRGLLGALTYAWANVLGRLLSAGVPLNHQGFAEGAEGLRSVLRA